MKYYFQLQYQIFRRQIEDIGFPFVVGLLLIASLYILLFTITIRYPQYNIWILGYASIFLLYKFSHPDRIDFIKNIFTRKRFLAIRFAENIGCTLLFIPMTVYGREWLIATFLGVLSLIFTFISIRRVESRNIPAPFPSSAFEFIIFFRRIYLLLVVFYVIAGISMYFDNSNFPIVLLSCVLIITLGAYDIIEDEYIVWNHTLSASGFLKRKIRIGSLHMGVLIIPFALLMLFFDMSIFPWVIICWGCGLLLLILTILMKYTAYPRSVGIVEAVGCIVIVVIPLFIIAAYFYFYKKAVQNLEKYL